MSRFWAEIAGLTVEVSALYEMTEKLFADYLTDNRSADFAVSVEPDDIEKERAIVYSQHIQAGEAVPNYTPEALEETVIHRKIGLQLPRYRAVVFHGSAVAVENRCYLFTAVSGTGKTTHTNLWLQHIPGSFIVNGDKPILRLQNDTVWVCGTPWMGKEKMGCNKSVPLHAVCFLGRGEENVITPCSFAQVMPQFIGQTYRPPQREAMLQTLQVLNEIGGKTDFYRLSCNMEPEAAWVSYRAMK